MSIARGQHNGSRLVGRQLRAHVLRAPSTQGQENDQKEDEKSAHGWDDNGSRKNALSLR